MAKLFGIIPYGGGSPVGEFVKDVGDVGSGFMSAAVQSAQTQDAREAAIADAVEKSVLSAKIGIDAKYPEFKKYEDTKLDQYKSLVENPAVGPDKAPFFYFAPGFLDKKTWLEDAIAWSQNPRNKDYKWTGSTMPEEKYAENINKYRTDVKGSFSGHHGDYMEKLFVSQDGGTDAPPTDAVTGVGTTDTEVTGVGATDTTGAVTATGGDGMFPPVKDIPWTKQKDKIAAKFLGYDKLGISGAQAVQLGFATSNELLIWQEMSKIGDKKWAAIDMAMEGNSDLVRALINENPDVVAAAQADIMKMANGIYNAYMLPEYRAGAMLESGVPEPETKGDKTYTPIGKSNDTGEDIWIIQGDESGTHYVKRMDAFLKAKNIDGKTIVEGSTEWKKLYGSTTSSPIKKIAETITGTIFPQ
jgi:hypothetical protein